MSNAHHCQRVGACSHRHRSRLLEKLKSFSSPLSQPLQPCPQPPLFPAPGAETNGTGRQKAAAQHNHSSPWASSERSAHHALRGGGCRGAKRTPLWKTAAALLSEPSKSTIFSSCCQSHSTPHDLQVKARGKSQVRRLPNHSAEEAQAQCPHCLLCLASASAQTAGQALPCPPAASATKAGQGAAACPEVVTFPAFQWEKGGGGEGEEKKKGGGEKKRRRNRGKSEQGEAAESKGEAGAGCVRRGCTVTQRRRGERRGQCPGLPRRAGGGLPRSPARGLGFRKPREPFLQKLGEL